MATIPDEIVPNLEINIEQDVEKNVSVDSTKATIAPILQVKPINNKKILIVVLVLLSMAALVIACRLSFRLNVNLKKAGENDLPLESNFKDMYQTPNIWITQSQSQIGERQLRNNIDDLPSFETFKANPKVFLKKVERNVKQVESLAKDKNSRKGSVTLINPRSQNLPSMQRAQIASKIDKNEKYIRYSSSVISKPETLKKSTVINFANIQPWRLNGNYNQANRSTFKARPQYPTNISFSRGIKV